MLLTARALADHDAATAAVTTPIRPVTGSSHPTTPSSSSSSGSGRLAEGRKIGETTMGHAASTQDSYKTGIKWVSKALEKLGHTWDDLVLNRDTTCDPNDQLASQVHNMVCDWRCKMVTARELGVKTHSKKKQDDPPPDNIYRLCKANMRNHINTIRQEKHIGVLHADWARDLAGVRQDTRDITRSTNDLRCENGSRYHSRQDLTLSDQQMMTMSVVGLTGDGRVDVDLLSAVETGAAFAIYSPTGARSSELTGADLQSLGKQEIQFQAGGTEWPSTHFTSLNTKTGSDHRNVMLATSNPWLCGVGGLGMSILVRVATYGHGPPLSMCKTPDSWKILITTGNKKTFERRLNTLFEMGHCRRQKGDVLSYAGRHIGTRNLQHQGGTAEGGAARRNHKQGNASHHYITVPLSDQLRLSGNHADERAFIPAHQTGGTLHDLVDVVLRILYPSLFTDRSNIARMNAEVDSARGDRVKRRTDLQLCDLERFNDGLFHVCRMALLCLVARPRKWERWSIDETQQTLWDQWRKKLAIVRTIEFLFSERLDAVTAMDALADAVRASEVSEIRARQVSSSDAASHQMAKTMREIEDTNREREERRLNESRAQQHQVMEYMATIMRASSTSPSPPPPPPPVAFAPIPSIPPPPPPAASSCLIDSLPSCKLKRARDDVSSEVIVSVAKWTCVSEMVEYARTHIARMDREHGKTWRTLHKSDGREDNGVKRHYLAYRRICAAVGLTSCEAVQQDLVTSGKSITKWLDGLAASNAARAHSVELEAAANRVMGL